jgi:hypothetical protein
LFDPNKLQRFAQQKGGMMKKRREKVLKRLCRSSHYCGSRNSDRENPMKTEEHLEPTAIFIQRVTAAVSELKDHLQQDYERTYPSLGEIIRIVLDEEEAKAWELSFFPHLFLADMVEAHIANLNLQPVETKHEPWKSAWSRHFRKRGILFSLHSQRDRCDRETGGDPSSIR